MAIQTRRGPEKDFDPNKLLPGEFAGTTDTKRIFYAFAAGDIKEMATYEDMQKEIENKTGDIVSELTDGVETAITNTNKATESANKAAMDANTAKEAADTAAYEASNAASEAREAAEAALSKGVSGVKGDKEVNFRTGNVNLTSENIGAVKIGGDVAENTVAFTSDDAGPNGEYAILSVEKLTTGEKISSLMQKISRVFTNVRYILKLLGTNDITSESVKIGDGTVTGAIRTLNDNLNGIQELKHIQLPNGLGVLFQQKIGDIVYCTLKSFNALIYQVNIGTTLGTLDIAPQSYITFYLIGNDGNKYRCGTDGYGNISNAEIIPPNIWYSCSFSYHIGS